jgi:hypothetical protein
MTFVTIFYNLADDYPDLFSKPEWVIGMGKRENNKIDQDYFQAFPKDWQDRVEQEMYRTELLNK